jgi:hypothetical protein
MFLTHSTPEPPGTLVDRVTATHRLVRVFEDIFGHVPTKTRALTNQVERFRDAGMDDGESGEDQYFCRACGQTDGHEARCMSCGRGRE